MNSLNRTARIAAILTLAIVVVGPIGLMLPSSLIVPGDAAATVDNVIASESTFRIGVAAQGVLILLEIALPIVLYVLLRPVNKTLSMIAALARLAMGTVQGINVFNHLAALQTPVHTLRSPEGGLAQPSLGGYGNPLYIRLRKKR
jgi:hypothetical protein